MDIGELLETTLNLKASDLHLAADTPPMVRVHGELQAVNKHEPLTAEDVTGIFHTVAPVEARQTFQDRKELDFSFSRPGLGRFRVNASFQRDTISLCFRPVPLSIPSIAALKLPEICKKLVTKSRGLIIIAGPTGSGKSTTLAAMVEYLNETATKRIITIEDPIEFIHSNKKSMIIQREIGADTVSFSEALRHVLRQDPDVILVGELRDVETISMALTAAETGHLVLTTLHTNGAVESVERLVDVFPAAAQEQVRYQLSLVLEGVIFQLLLPRASGDGRVPAVEVLAGTMAIRNLIRQNELHQIKSYLHSGAGYGMQTLEQALAALVKAGEITPAEAKSRASDLKGLEILLLKSY
ncbi:MAG: type IV pilus twitching motility protein PilT [Chloroflexi bacterium]|nr:type IV pilus twitching motility protein PilT [Chloroflexota bacterium]